MPGEPEVINANSELIAKAEIAASTIPELKDIYEKRSCSILGNINPLDPLKVKQPLLKIFLRPMVTECEGAPDCTDRSRF